MPSPLELDGMDHFELAMHSQASVVFVNLPSYTNLKKKTNLYNMTKGMTEGAVMRKRLPAGTYLIVMCKRVFRGIWVVWWRLQ